MPSFDARQILVPVDFSPVTDAAVEVAAGLATRCGSHLWLVHVAAPDPDFVGYEAGPQSVRDSVASELHTAHRDLQGIAGKLRKRGIEATALLIQGPTVETIVSEVERLPAGLVVMGSHGRGALHRALLGSVSEGVLRRAPCPILVVPSRETRD